MVVAGARSGRSVAGDEGEGPRFALRFEDGRGLLCLAQPLRFAYGVVEELELSLGELRFPLDLSAGPRRFRGRRTAVRAARVRLDPVALLGDRVEEPYRLVPLAPRAASSSWALTDPFGTVAFDLLARMDGSDLLLAIGEARSAHEGPAPPAVRVLAAARAMGLELDEGRGALRLPRVLSSVLMEALVPWGWRVPDDRGVRLALEVAGPRQVVLRRREAGEADAEVEPDAADPWEQARRLGPVLAAFGRGDADGARRTWEALLERVGRAPEALARAARGLYLAPDSRLPSSDASGEGPQDLTLALRAALRESRVAQAVARASALAEVEPCDAVAVEALCAAAELARSRDPSSCVALLEKAVARRPRDGRLALRLVEALAQLEPDGALWAMLDGALSAREPGSERSALARDAALVCALAQRHEEAARLWRVAAEGLPQDGRVLDGVAGAEARDGRLVQAIALWDQAAEAHRRDGDEEAAAAALQAAGRAAEAAGRLEVAEERLTRLVEHAPGPEPLAALARVRRALGATGAAGRAEDALLDALQEVSLGSVSDAVVEAVVDALREAAESASARGERERERAFQSALGRWCPTSAPRLSGGMGTSADSEGADEPSEPSDAPEVASATASALLARARAAAHARDSAGLRAALAAAERAGERAVALQIVEIALEAVGDGPARRALEAARARLDER